MNANYKPFTCADRLRVNFDRPLGPARASSDWSMHSGLFERAYI